MITPRTAPLGGLRWLAIATLLCGCGFNESPHHCKSKGDCATNRECVFTVKDGCTGVGHCDDNPSCVVSKTSMPRGACGCDGGVAFEATTFSGGPVCGWDRPVVSDV